MVSNDDPDQVVMLREVAAYKAMHADLVKHHLGQWVAVHGGQLVDHDGDEVSLWQRRLRDYPDKVVMIRQVETEADHELYFPSFHLEAL